MANSVFGQFFRANAAALTASNSSFTPVLNQTSISGDTSLASLSSEFGAVVSYVHKRLGEPVLLVELTPDQIAICFEEAQLTFSSIVNTYFIESWIASLLGLQKDYSQFDFQNKLPQANDQFFKLFAQNQLYNFGIYSGHHTKRRGYVITEANEQTYDVFSEAYDDSTGLSIEAYIASVSGYGVHFLNFYVNGEFYMNRLYDPLTNQQFMASEFGFPSYPTDTVFYILPVWQDIQRGQLLKTSDYTRKSRIQWSRFGRNVEFIPRPKSARKIWFDFYVDLEPGTNTDPMLSTSYSGFNYMLSASANQVATNFGNIPIKDLTYDTMNSIGRTWVRKYTLALCMETLGLIRGKLGAIPIPGGDTVTLNYDALLSRGQSMMQQLEDGLKAELAKIDTYEIMRKETEKAQQQLEFMKTQPLGGFVF